MPKIGPTCESAFFGNAHRILTPHTVTIATTNRDPYAVADIVEVPRGGRSARTDLGEEDVCRSVLGLRRRQSEGGGEPATEPG